MSTGTDHNPEWTDEDFAGARPASELHGPDAAGALVRKLGRPRKAEGEAMHKRYWLIEGDEGTGTFFRAIYPLSRYSEGQIVNLLETLSAKHGLNYREICDAKGRRKTALLDVHRSFFPISFMAGPSAVFTARVLEDRDERLLKPIKG